jgi:hypothetical protein
MPPYSAFSIFTPASITWVACGKLKFGGPPWPLMNPIVIGEPFAGLELKHNKGGVSFVGSPGAGTTLWRSRLRGAVCSPTPLSALAEFRPHGGAFLAFPSGLSSEASASGSTFLFWDDKPGEVPIRLQLRIGIVSAGYWRLCGPPFAPVLRVWPLLSQAAFVLQWAMRVSHCSIRSFNDLCQIIGSAWL